MYAGCGRAGDYAGDPLDWLDTEYICWVTPSMLQIKAVWTMTKTFPKTGIVYTYNEGTVIERGSSSPKTFNALIAGVIPKLAAVAVAPAVNDPTYDPLGGEHVANLVDLIQLPAAPVNVMCRNVGDGSIEVSWDEVLYAGWYNVYMSLTSGGQYSKTNLAQILDNKVRLPNISFGLTVFIKATAENEIGESGKSNLAQDALCSPGVATLLFEGLVGDRIPAGTMFTKRVNTKLVTFVTTTEGVVV